MWRKREQPVRFILGSPTIGRAIVIGLATVLTACATCRPETFLKPSLDLPLQRSIAHIERAAIQFDTSPRLRSAFRECILDGRLVPGSICFYLRVAPGSKVKLESTEILITRTDTSSVAKIRPDRFDYVIYCRKKGESAPECSSPEDSPIDGLPEVLARFDSFIPPDRSGSRTLYSFDARLEFNGATDTNMPVIWRTVDEKDNWREYQLVILGQSALDGPPIDIDFPKISVDGHVISFPKVRFSRRTEEVCYVRQIQ